MKKPRKLQEGVKLRGEDKIRRIPSTSLTPQAGSPRPEAKPKPKPDWIRVKIPASEGVSRIRQLLRRRNLSTVCEEASCPNLGEWLVLLSVCPTVTWADAAGAYLGESAARNVRW